MRIAIIVLNFNNYKDTIACVKSILPFLDDHTNLYVVDNNSTDDSILFLNEAFNQFTNPYLTFIKNHKNNGYAGGNNYGITYAMNKIDYDYYWVLNNDTIVPVKSFFELQQYALLHPELELIGTVQVFYELPNIIQTAGGIYYAPFSICKNIYKNNPITSISRNIENADYPSGASLLVKKSFIEKVGLLNERYFLFFEEIDWVNRARKIYKNRFWDICTNCIILHKEGGTNKNHSSASSTLSEYFFHRNRILITAFYYPQFQYTVMVSLFVSVLKRLIFLKPKRALNIYTAIRDGYRYSIDE